MPPLCCYWKDKNLLQATALLYLSTNMAQDLIGDYLQHMEEESENMLCKQMAIIGDLKNKNILGRTSNTNFVKKKLRIWCAQTETCFIFFYLHLPLRSVLLRKIAIYRVIFFTGTP